MYKTRVPEPAISAIELSPWPSSINYQLQQKIHIMVTSRFIIPILDEDVLATPGGVEPKASFVVQGTSLAMSAMTTDANKELVTLLERNISKHLILQCDMAHVVHGTTVAEGSLATLVVFQFTFAARSPDRRFKEAQIEITFSEAATVDKIEPNGQFAAGKSTIEQEVSHTISPTLAAQFGPANATMGYTWQRTEKQNVEGAIRVGGMNLSRGTTNNRKNHVLWTLDENAQTNKGIPSFLQAAVLLKRHHDSPFSASMVIRGKVDNKRWAQDGWGNTVSKMSNEKLPGKDIWFDPKEPIGDNSKIDAKSLSLVPLDSYRQLITVKDWTDGSPQTGKEQPLRHQVVSDNTQAEHAIVQDHASTRPIQQEGTTAPEVTKAAHLTTARNTPSIKNPDPSDLNAHETEPEPPIDRDPASSTAQVSRPTQEQRAAATQDIDGALPLAVLEQDLALVRKEAKFVDHLVKLVQEERRLLHQINSWKVHLD